MSCLGAPSGKKLFCRQLITVHSISFSYLNNPKEFSLLFLFDAILFCSCIILFVVCILWLCLIHWSQLFFISVFMQQQRLVRCAAIRPRQRSVGGQQSVLHPTEVSICVTRTCKHLLLIGKFRPGKILHCIRPT